MWQTKGHKNLFGATLIYLEKIELHSTWDGGRLTEDFVRLNGQSRLFGPVKLIFLYKLTYEHVHRFFFARQKIRPQS